MSKRKNRINKGLSRIVGIIDRYIESLGCESGGLQDGFRCKCYDDECTVMYSLFSFQNDDTVLQFAKDEFNIDDISIFTLSLLHEVGHIATQCELTKKEDAYCWAVKVMLSEQDRWSEGVTKAYMRLPDEYMATQWACDYIHNNRKEVLHFDNLLKKELKNYYRKWLTE